jgi:DNA-directed RNA polymerase subunit RPC12/RpoP
MKTRLRKITLEHYHQLDDDMAGLCTACGNEQHGLEPDVERVRCEACGERKVYGPHWYLMTGMVE